MHAPRFWPLNDDGTLEIESRIGADVLKELYEDGDRHPAPEHLQPADGVHAGGVA